MSIASSQSILESSKTFASLALVRIACALRLIFAKRGEDKEVDNSPMLDQPGDSDF